MEYLLTQATIETLHHCMLYLNDVQHVLWNKKASLLIQNIQSYDFICSLWYLWLFFEEWRVIGIFIHAFLPYWQEKGKSSNGNGNDLLVLVLINSCVDSYGNGNSLLVLVLINSSVG